MGRKRAERKQAILRRVAKSVQSFYPEIQGAFICPTCLRRVPTGDRNDITEAHVLPRASGGVLRTLLCRDCNSTFGKQQDKWLGEYLRLLSEPLAPISAKHQAGHFEVGGQRVNGRYQVSHDGNINFLVWTNKNSPVTLGAQEKITAQARAGGALRLRLPVPVLANKDLVTSGFVTAAYLLWFRELGYGWALQNHLDIVRKQIVNPRKRMLPTSATAASLSYVFKEPSIGVCRVEGELLLFAGLADRLVFFPPVDRPNVYEILPPKYDGVRSEEFKLLNFGRQQTEFPGPVGVVIGTRLVVAADVVMRGTVKAPVIIFPEDGSSPRVLYPISEDEYALQLQRSNVSTLNIKVNVSAPPNDTGR